MTRMMTRVAEKAENNIPYFTPYFLPYSMLYPVSNSMLRYRALNSMLPTLLSGLLPTLLSTYLPPRLPTYLPTYLTLHNAPYSYLIYLQRDPMGISHDYIIPWYIPERYLIKLISLKRYGIALSSFYIISRYDIAWDGICRGIFYTIPIRRRDIPTSSILIILVNSMTPIKLQGEKMHVFFLVTYIEPYSPPTRKRNIAKVMHK